MNIFKPFIHLFDLWTIYFNDLNAFDYRSITMNHEDILKNHEDDWHCSQCDGFDGTMDCPTCIKRFEGLHG